MFLLYSSKVIWSRSYDSIPFQALHFRFFFLRLIFLKSNLFPISPLPASDIIICMEFLRIDVWYAQSIFRPCKAVSAYRLIAFHGQALHAKATIRSFWCFCKQLDQSIWSFIWELFPHSCHTLISLYIFFQNESLHKETIFFIHNKICN